MQPRRLPIIKLWNRILVPIQGEITDDLADQITHEVLRTIHETGPQGLVLDITGVWIMDSHLCSVLSNLATSAGLMGTPTIICGLSPEIAMTLQTMGVELEGVRTTLTLEQALERLGLEVEDTFADDDEDDEDEDEDDDDEGDEERGAREVARAGLPPSAARGRGKAKRR